MNANDLSNVKAEQARQGAGSAAAHAVRDAIHAETAYAEGCLQQSQGYSPLPSTSSLLNEAQQRADYHSSESAKAQSAAVFFRQNPGFEEFIRLVRSGAIQF